MTPSLGLTFRPVPFVKAAMLIGYGDSSWANAPGAKSQMGSLVLFAPPGSMEKKCYVSIFGLEVGPFTTSRAVDVSVGGKCHGRDSGQEHIL